MANASNYALRRSRLSGRQSLRERYVCRRHRAWRFVDNAKLLVMMVGTVALLAGGVLISSEEARSLLMRGFRRRERLKSRG